MADDYDYTAGDAIPEEALAENFTIGGTGAIEHDANKVESENSFHDLTPGNYLLKVAGFGKIEPKARTTHVNGQSVQYSAYQVEVRFADANDPSGRIRTWFTLPPDDPTFLRYYNLGGNEKGTPQSVGFFAKQFGHFVDRLLPGQAYAPGSKSLSNFARSLANWKGRTIWAQVEAGKEDATKVNPTTGDPYPPRTGIKMYSYRAYIEGQGCPYDSAPATSGKPANGTTKRPTTPVGNPTAALESAGLGVI